MSTPTQKTNKAHQRSRRSHHALKPININKCESCGASILPHHACQKCGNYKGRKVKK